MDLIEMNEQMNNHHRQSIIERLMPGAGLVVYRNTTDNDRYKRTNHKIYRVLSCMSAAMRSRADAHMRSTERVEIPSASEVSAVVKPAK
jgi:hypothetical protein